MPRTLDKKSRVRNELLVAGVTGYGIRKSESQALYDHIGEDEHVLAAIYGQIDATSAMMVATDQRLLFIDVRALHNIVEDIPYDSFGDLRIDEGIAFSRVTLNTRPREYLFRMVNRRCARRFLNVIDQIALGRKSSISHEQAKKMLASKAKAVVQSGAATPDEIEFLLKHNVATLSTRGDAGYPYGATVFYIYDKESPDHIYSVTKSTTTTAANLRRSQKVAYTITDEKTMTTMHVLGVAELEKQTARKNQILSFLFKYGDKLSVAEQPPVIQMREGSFLVYKTKIESVSVR